MLDWDSQRPNASTEIARLLLLVRRVRNNLFHGGKCNERVAEETARNEKLLRHGIIILTEALKLNSSVWGIYEDSCI